MLLRVIGFSLCFALQSSLIFASAKPDDASSSSTPSSRKASIFLEDKTFKEQYVDVAQPAFDKSERELVIETTHAKDIGSLRRCVLVEDVRILLHDKGIACFTPSKRWRRYNMRINPPLKLMALVQEPGCWIATPDYIGGNYHEEEITADNEEHVLKSFLEKYRKVYIEGPFYPKEEIHTTGYWVDKMKDSNFSVEVMKSYWVVRLELDKLLRDAGLLEGEPEKPEW